MNEEAKYKLAESRLQLAFGIVLCVTAIALLGQVTSCEKHSENELTWRQAIVKGTNVLERWHP